MPELTVDPADVSAVVDVALAEDVGRGDLTTRATVPQGARLTGVFSARQDMVVCGMPIAEHVLNRLAPEAQFQIECADGERAGPGTALARIDGPAEGVLTAERTALNALQFLSGIATLTRQYVDEISHTGATLLDTRKTIPGLRNLSKYAVRCGGGANHRMRLDDGVLIKDNHIAVSGGVGEAVRKAKSANLGDLKVQAECDTLDQLREALDAGVDAVLLDNMSNDQLREAVRITSGRIPLEASGGVALDTIRAIAETGVDYISVGAITQRAPAVDIGLDFDLVG